MCRKFRYRIQCRIHILDPRVTFFLAYLERHVSLTHTRMSALLAVGLPAASALDKKECQMLFAGRQIFRVERSQDWVFFDTRIKVFDQPVKRLVRTNRLIYQSYGVNHVHNAIIQRRLARLNPPRLWAVKELSVLKRLYRPNKEQSGT